MGVTGNNELGGRNEGGKGGGSRLKSGPFLYRKYKHGT